MIQIQQMYTLRKLYYLMYVQSQVFLLSYCSRIRRPTCLRLVKFNRQHRASVKHKNSNMNTEKPTYQCRDVGTHKIFQTLACDQIHIVTLQHRKTGTQLCSFCGIDTKFGPARKKITLPLLKLGDNDYCKV